MDSLDPEEIVMALEKRFACGISNEEAQQVFSSIRAAVLLMDGKVKSKGA